MIFQLNENNQRKILNAAIAGASCYTTLCRYQARVNGEASQNTQHKIPLKWSFYILIFSFFTSTINFYLYSCLLELVNQKFHNKGVSKFNVAYEKMF